MERKLKRSLKTSRVLTVIMTGAMIFFGQNEFHISISVLAVQAIILYKLIYALVFVSICMEMKDKEIKGLIKKTCKDTSAGLAVILILLIELLILKEFDAIKFLKITSIAIAVHLLAIVPIYFQKEVYETYELKRKDTNHRGNR